MSHFLSIDIISTSTPISRAIPVERLYCKRPILCLSSSKILTPTPSPTGECVHLAFGAGEGHTCWVKRGRVVNIMEDARHCSVLYIRKYFVDDPHMKFFPSPIPHLQVALF
jgi:hypothetical protein